MLNNKSLQAFLAIGPIVLFVLLMMAYFVFFFTMISSAQSLENFDENGSAPFPTEFFAGFGVFFVLILLTVFLSFFSLVYFIIHAAKNPNLEGDNSNMKIVWILILAFLSGIGQLVYWIVEIKTKNPKPVIPN